MRLCQVSLSLSLSLALALSRSGVRALSLLAGQGCHRRGCLGTGCRFLSAVKKSLSLSSLSLQTLLGLALPQRLLSGSSALSGLSVLSWLPLL